MKLVPETRFGELIPKLNDVLGRGIYADPSSFEMRLLKRGCEEVRNVDPTRGWALLGSYHTLLGDFDESERCFSAALRLDTHPVLRGNYYATLSNLGYFSKAHQYFLEVGQPELGGLSVLNEYVRGMGSFQTAVAFNKAAQSKGITIERPLDEANVQAASVLAKAGITDEQTVRHMEAVGVVLRRHKLFFDEQVRVNVCDVDGVFVGVTSVVGVNKTAREVFDLNIELATVEDEMGIEKHPAFDVMFKPV